MLSLDEILSSVEYDLIVDDTYTYHGNIDYVSDHFGVGTSNKLYISHTQPENIKKFMDKYFQVTKNPAFANYSISDFYAYENEEHK